MSWEIQGKVNIEQLKLVFQPSCSALQCHSGESRNGCHPEYYESDNSKTLESFSINLGPFKTLHYHFQYKGIQDW